MAQKKRPKQATVSFKDGSYFCTQEKGRLKVQIGGTAKGQKTYVGNYMIDTGKWNVHKRQYLPEEAKRTILERFGITT